MAKGLDQIRTDIVRAYAARDTEKLKGLLGDYSRAKAAQARSAANIRADEAAQGPDVSGSQFLPGAGFGLTKVAGQLAQLAAPKRFEEALDTDLIPVSDEARAEAERRAEALRSTRSGRLGQFVGEVAAAAPAGGIAGGVARGALARGGAALAPKGATAKALLELTKLPKYARYGGYAAEGAAGQAATTGEVTPGGALTGVVGGRLGEALGAAGAAAVRGLKRSPGAEKLLEYGADLTAGQLSPEGFLNRLERTAEVSPILGQAVREAREKATERVVPELISDIAGVKPRTTIPSASSAVKRKVGALYGPAKPVSKPREADLLDFRGRMESSIAEHAPPSVAEVEGQLRSVWSRVARANNTQQIKGILSDLRAKSRSLKYAKGGAGSIETARVYDDAAKWLDSYYKRGLSPSRVRQIEKADKIVAAYKPIEAATRGAMAGARKAPMGRELLRQLAKSETPGQFVRGENVGETRRVAEALAEHEAGLAAQGGVERTPWLRQLLALGLVVPARAAQSAPVRRLAQGQTAAQRAAQGALSAQVPGTRTSVSELLEALYKVRAGVPGAISDELDEVKY